MSIHIHIYTYMYMYMFVHRCTAMPCQHRPLPRFSFGPELQDQGQQLAQGPRLPDRFLDELEFALSRGSKDHRNTSILTWSIA